VGAVDLDGHLAEPYVASSGAGKLSLVGATRTIDP
jgi:hypothetical protein